MKKIKKWIEKQNYALIENEDENAFYYLLPFCIIFFDKEQEVYFISFDIQEDKSFCFSFFFEIQSHFQNIDFNIYYDCCFSVNEFDQVEFFVFGDKAKEQYFQFIHAFVEHEFEIPKDVLFH